MINKRQHTAPSRRSTLFILPMPPDARKSKLWIFPHPSLSCHWPLPFLLLARWGPEGATAVCCSDPSWNWRLVRRFISFSSLFAFYTRVPSSSLLHPENWKFEVTQTSCTGLRSMEGFGGKYSFFLHSLLFCCHEFIFLWFSGLRTHIYSCFHLVLGN